jgi:hypothetical protein
MSLRALALLVVLVAAPLAAPLALAHSLAGVPVLSGTPAATGVPARAPAAFQPLSLAQEAPVVPTSIPQGNGASWASAPETSYDLKFVCPPIAQQADTSKAPQSCPTYVLDVEDVMAQPALVVDPGDPSFIAFNALHGGPGVRAPTQDPLPTEHSRSDLVHQPHTTFWSTDAGSTWDDNRYYPRGLDNKAEVFGEDNAMAADPHGDMTIASLYSFYNQSESSSALPVLPTAPPTGTGNDPGYAVAIWSAGKAGEKVDYDKAYIVHTAPMGHTMDSVQAASFPAAKSMAVLWRETDSDGSSLMLLHRGSDNTGQWESIEHAATNCQAITNAVAVGERLLVGCIQGKAGRGDLHLYGFAANWTVEDLGMAPLRGVTGAVLASAESVRAGGFVMAGSGITDGRPHVWVSFGLAKQDLLPSFSRSRDYGDHLTALASHAGASLVESRVTALAFLGTSATAHLVYMERYTGGSSAGPSAEFAKTYAAVQADGRFLGTWGLGFGDPQANANVPVLVSGSGTGAFDDAHDSLVVTHPKHGGERLFLAFGDHGYVRFAEVTEVQPPVALFPPIGAPAAIPTLTAATNPVVVGSVAGALSLAAVSRMALARSKKTAEAPAP